MNHNITARKQMEEALRQSEAQYRMIAENTSDGIVVWDNRRLQVTYASPSHERIMGRANGESVGMDWESLSAQIHPDDRVALRARYREAVQRRQETVNYTYRIRHRDGHYLWREDHARLNYGPDGEYLNAYIVVRDITERKQAHAREFELALEKERIDLLSRFIHSAAHEFRTPLSIIGTTAYLLIRMDDPERRRLKKEQIDTQVKRISKLLEMVLLLIKLQTIETVTWLPIAVDILLENRRRHYGGLYGDRPALRVETPDDLPVIQGDAGYLSQALDQLLDNAYRFTPEEGTIAIVAGASEDTLWVEVRDTGSGIAPEELPHIFQTFWRHDEAHTTAGFGLGLSIVQRVIQLHGGTISVSSMLGQGTSFRITLPIAPKSLS